jgi:recombination protein RecR
MEYPPALTELIAALRQLPSVGARSAERLALFLLRGDSNAAGRLARAITRAQSDIESCPRCGFFSQKGQCVLCDNPAREKKLWCVVEQPSDVLRLEKAGNYKGLYHVLGGRLSPLDDVGPEKLRIGELEKRIEAEQPQEIIIALGADVEGETTALYLAPIIKKRGVKVSRLATGLPAGTGLEHADSVTLGYAIRGRTDL